MLQEKKETFILLQHVLTRQNKINTAMKQALLCSIELGSIKCNLETAKIGVLLWENMSTSIAKLPKSDFAHL